MIEVCRTRLGSIILYHSNHRKILDHVRQTLNRMSRNAKLTSFSLVSLKDQLLRPRYITTSSIMSAKYKLVFFTPPLDLPKIKEAIFKTGAGSYPGPGGYTEVCFTTPGIGQFKPGDSAKPHIGAPGKLEEVGAVSYTHLTLPTKRIV